MTKKLPEEVVDRRGGKKKETEDVLKKRGVRYL